MLSCSSSNLPLLSRAATRDAVSLIPRGPMGPHLVPFGGARVWQGQILPLQGPVAVTSAKAC